MHRRQTACPRHALQHPRKRRMGSALPGLLLRPARPSDGPAQRKRGGGAETAESPNRRGGGAFRRKVFGTAIACTSSIACVAHSFLARFFWPKETKKKNKKTKTSAQHTQSMNGCSSRAARGGRRKAGNAGKPGKAPAGGPVRRTVCEPAPAPPSPGPHRNKIDLSLSLSIRGRRG